MHPQAYHFVRAALGGVDTAKLSVLELGSYNVNGTVRDHFPGAHYFGIDRVAGPGVDAVCELKDFDPIVPFDVVISTEVAEHTPDPGDIVRTAYRCLRRGGLFVLTCAASPRAPHGWMGTPLVPAGEFYANVRPVLMWELLSDSTLWLHVSIQHDRDHGDLRVSAVKA